MIGERRKLARVLVVDTAGFIKNVAFDDYADEVVTLEEVTLLKSSLKLHPVTNCQNQKIHLGLFDAL